MKQQASEQTRPWYKEPIMWLVVGVPLVTVCWGMVMLTLALSSKDSLVSDSYYKDGMSYTENTEIDHKAGRLQVRANLVISDHEARLNLQGYFDEEPNMLLLRLIHPTLQDRDADVLLQRIADGLYVGAAEVDLPSRRHIWLQSPDQGWRVRATENLSDGQVITLIAK
ncbi:FixH family protein [Oceanobacter kriegii]|uniref:FixH family protein n=1 Tax=Oceanobacter kriegii TaxID=64972 RepID=UPI000A033627|nr:FixH family protein [Oceanobacter kriegii]